MHNLFHKFLFMLVNKVLVFYILGFICLGVIYEHAMTMLNSWEGWDRIFSGYIQDPLRVCRSPDLFPALFDTWVCWTCLKRRSKMSEPSTPRGRKRSRASPPRKYFTIIYHFASCNYCPFSYLFHIFAKASFNTTICRSVLHTRPSNCSNDLRPNFIH